MDARRRSATAASLALAGLALWAPSASATFHLISVREVYPGSAASATAEKAEYVELQMYSGGQDLVGGHILRTYSAGGVATKNVLATDVPSGANQSTILLATPEAEAQFGVTADGALSPSGQLDPAGGAVCWESIDCVSWGSFSGSLPSAGSPAGAIPDGMALRRTISPGCPTLLEAADDSDSSAADFSPVFPAPRPNSFAPTEHACSSPGQNPQEGHGAPQTRLRRRPPNRTHDRTPTFRFASSEPNSTFQCRLDRKPFRPCRSPFTARRLSYGRHTFAVRAVDAAGHRDPTPVSDGFRIIRGSARGLFR